MKRMRQRRRRGGAGDGIELSKGNNTSNLFLPLCIFKRWRGEGGGEESCFNN